MEHASVARERLEAEVRSSRKASAELMQGHSNVARSLLAEEMRMLDNEWAEEREEQQAEAEAAQKDAQVKAARVLSDADARKRRADDAERKAARVFAEAQAQAMAAQQAAQKADASWASLRRAKAARAKQRQPKQQKEKQL